MSQVQVTENVDNRAFLLFEKTVTKNCNFHFLLKFCHLALMDTERFEQRFETSENV